MMKNDYHEITVSVEPKPYPIYVGKELLGQTSILQRHIKAKQVFIVTNQTIAPLYLALVKQAFVNYQCDWLILPDGELYKNLDVLNEIFDALLTHKHHRDTTLVALGGGVIGDITGFAAACYQRGVSFMQIPTTLLAQVDAAIGGKTAVNHPRGKNMIGAFHQPQCVIIDTNTLKTLPIREFQAGLAEVIKYSLITPDDVFFSWLENNVSQLLQLSSAQLNYAIEYCCGIKAKIVAEDEKELGIRALLNLGHTFAHAIETATHYQTYLHGEAVAIGLYCASLLSFNLGNLDLVEVNRIHSLLKKAGLPTTIPKDLDHQTLLRLMASDKKVTNHQLRFIVLQSIGDAYVTEQITESMILEVLIQASNEP